MGFPAAMHSSTPPQPQCVITAETFGCCSSVGCGSHDETWKEGSDGSGSAPCALSLRDHTTAQPACLSALKRTTTIHSGRTTIVPVVT